jgi:hypothetical protein
LSHGEMSQITVRISKSWVKRTGWGTEKAVSALPTIWQWTSKSLNLSEFKLPHF